MKRLVIELRSCKGCPYLQWEEDNSCSNNSGWSKCGNMDRFIAQNTKEPEFPFWCPITDVVK